ncbi:E3 ubiquitin-protein ligase TRIM39-like [Carcharodon carcharias]|uniref:E3 ubiquitin-protein ligase TRIM39-like n=1 Tax=Carcharodon carcharias TaxID=13397 RepID=UPI001B7E5B79|nr:E3 ubiquitin-protein ligase TRIM39-like [Carcharodon carcharias]
MVDVPPALLNEGIKSRSVGKRRKIFDQVVENQRVSPPIPISVNLDVETASPWLEVSEDLKSLRRTRTWRSLPDTGKRFTDWLCPCVLGSEGFTSGRHYWEVEGNRRWRLGVAAESVERKDRVSLSPETGFWIIERVGDEFYIKSSPESRLPVGQIPGKVGVYLSYESGTVSFYSADTKSHLHSFTGNKFTEKLYPFFCTWNENQILRICFGSDWIRKRGGASGGGRITPDVTTTTP